MALGFGSAGSVQPFGLAKVRKCVGCKYRDASVTFAVTVRRPQWRDFELKLEKVCTVRALPLR